MTEKLQPSRADIYGEGWAAAALGSMGGEPVTADDEPCLCGTGFTCLASEHGKVVGGE